MRALCDSNFYLRCKTFRKIFFIKILFQRIYQVPENSKEKILMFSAFAVHVCKFRLNDGIQNRIQKPVKQRK